MEGMNVKIDRLAADQRLWCLGVGGRRYRDMILDAMEECVVDTSQPKTHDDV